MVMYNISHSFSPHYNIDLSFPAKSYTYIGLCSFCVCVFCDTHRAEHREAAGLVTVCVLQAFCWPLTSG